MLHPKHFWYFLRDLYRGRWLIYQMTKKDFHERFVASYLGITWAFIHPLATMAVLWFVFQVGFKAKPIADVPFSLWLMAGFIPWIFFYEALYGATMSIVDKGFLIKKVVFRVSILPIVKVLTALIIHVAFVGLLFGVHMYTGQALSLYNLQIFYYLFAAVCLVLGIAWFTSALTVFIRDVGQVLQVVLQIGMWLTPVFWELRLIPKSYHHWLKFNPVYYIVEGYRDALINKMWFWEHYRLTPYFWGVVALCWAVGAFTFRRLRPHFADVIQAEKQAEPYRND